MIKPESPADRNIEVLFPIRGGGPYTYSLPKGLEQGVEPGVRVVASLGRRLLTGVVAASGVKAPAGVRLKQVREIIDERPLLPGNLTELAGWISSYYFCHPGEALKAIVPGIFLAVGDRIIRITKKEEPLKEKLTPLQGRILEHLEASGAETLLSRLKLSFKPVNVLPHLARLEMLGLIGLEDSLPKIPRARMRTMLEAAQDPPAGALEKLYARKTRQRELFELLSSMSNPVESSLVTRQMGFSRQVVKALADKGLVKATQLERARDPFENLEFPLYEAPTPSPAQQKAIDSIRISLGSHRVFLLHGVTGSGKTLVYLELLEPVIASGGQAIVLVPEIALTPQTMGRFRSVFGDRVAVLHSGLSDGERYDIWRQIRKGRYCVAVGARSAVFAPFERLGVIVIDEEHEHTYKQDSTPRYHAREVAIERMKRAGGPVVLGSATPSLESFYRARTGEYTLLELPERAAGLTMPEVAVHDLRKGWSAKSPTLLRKPLLKEIGFAVEASGQVLLLLNRRGYSNFILCEECGHVAGCSECQISLTVHKRLNRLVCHYCGRQQPVPERCTVCGSEWISQVGIGTEQVENLLRTHFPDYVIDRMDLDTTGGKWSHHEKLERLRKGETQIMVGTQMIAKGLDFPDVLLVGVVNADTAMNLPDFRSYERTFQLLSQVAGRTGRGERGGEVIIQTFNPSHPAVKAAVTHDYISFAAGELSIRREAGYPPYVRLLNVILTGTDARTLESFAADAAREVRKLISGRPGTFRDLHVIGPAPCPIEKLRGRFRRHLILKSRSPEVIGLAGSHLGRKLRPPRKGDCRLILDRDPASLM